MKEKCILVCDKCLRVSCLTGDFYCEDYKKAGVKKMKKKELEKLKLENLSYWN